MPDSYTRLDLPKEFSEFNLGSNLGYSFYDVYSCKAANSHLYAVYSGIPRIYDTENGESFAMKNLPDAANNDEFFAKSAMLKNDSLIKYKNLSFFGLHSTNQQSLIVIGRWKEGIDSDKYTWFAQEYSVNGELMGMRILPNTEDTDNEKIQWISYSKTDNAIYVFYISKKNGWKATAYQWEAS